MAEGKLFPDLILCVLNIGAGGVNELLLIGVFGLRAVQPWQALTGPRCCLALLHQMCCILGAAALGGGLHRSHSVLAVPLITSALSLQCYTKQGLELTRVTVINSELKVVYDTFVKPDSKVVDYNTR